MYLCSILSKYTDDKFLDYLKNEYILDILEDNAELDYQFKHIYQVNAVEISDDKKQLYLEIKDLNNGTIITIDLKYIAKSKNFVVNKDSIIARTCYKFVDKPKRVINEFFNDNDSLDYVIINRIGYSYEDNLSD